MAKFFGNVGFAIPEKIAGVATDVMHERPYRGDFERMSRRMETQEGINDDLVVVNTISIIADGFAEEHFFAIRYVCWQGTRWKVNSVEVKRPRLIMTLGVVWNGPVPSEV